MHASCLYAQQQEANRIKVEMLRRETEQSLEQLRQNLKPTSIRPIARAANVDVFSEIQHQVKACTRLLPTADP